MKKSIFSLFLAILLILSLAAPSFAAAPSPLPAHFTATVTSTQSEKSDTCIYTYDRTTGALRLDCDTYNSAFLAPLVDFSKSEDMPLLLAAFNYVGSLDNGYTCFDNGETFLFASSPLILSGTVKQIIIPQPHVTTIYEFDVSGGRLQRYTHRDEYYRYYRVYHYEGGQLHFIETTQPDVGTFPFANIYYDAGRIKGGNYTSSVHGFPFTVEYDSRGRVSRTWNGNTTSRYLYVGDSLAGLYTTSNKNPTQFTRSTFCTENGRIQQFQFRGTKSKQNVIFNYN